MTPTTTRPSTSSYLHGDDHGDGCGRWGGPSASGGAGLGHPDVGPMEVLERPRRRRTALALVAARGFGRAVGLLGRRREPEEAHLPDLHAGPELDRQGRDVAQLQRDVAREP